jgi:hypothetical protein
MLIDDRFYFTFPFMQADTRAELHHYTFLWVKRDSSKRHSVKTQEGVQEINEQRNLVIMIVILDTSEITLQ